MFEFEFELAQIILEKIINFLHFYTDNLLNHISKLNAFLIQNSPIRLTTTVRHRIVIRQLVYRK